MLTRAEIKEHTIKEMAQAGAMLSRQCRNCWTGERIRTNLSHDEFVGKIKYLRLLAVIPRNPLIDWADVADLNQFYLGKSDQHTWNTERWEKEIRMQID